MLIGDKIAIDNMIIETITKQKYNKNIDIDYTTIRIEPLEDQNNTNGFILEANGSIRKRSDEIMGQFKIAIEQRIVPSELYQHTKQ